MYYEQVDVDPGPTGAAPSPAGDEDGDHDHNHDHDDRPERAEEISSDPDFLSSDEDGPDRGSEETQAMIREPSSRRREPRRVGPEPTWGGEIECDATPRGPSPKRRPPAVEAEEESTESAMELKEQSSETGPSPATSTTDEKDVDVVMEDAW